MRRFFSSLVALLLVVSMPMQVQAAERSSLSLALQELTYAVTVEWDQKDMTFYQSSVSRFASELKRLREAGATDAEVIAELEALTEARGVASELELLRQVSAATRVSSAEMSRLALDAAIKTQKQGANYIGSTQTGKALLISAGVVLAVIGILLAVRGNGGSQGSTPSDGTGSNPGTGGCKSDCPSSEICREWGDGIRGDVVCYPCADVCGIY